MSVVMIPTDLRRIEYDDEVTAIATLPHRATTEAACHDIKAFLPNPPGVTGAIRELTLPPLQVIKVPTGLRVALPQDSALLVCSRSGLAAQGVQVINAPGIIDSDYRGEIFVMLTYIAPPDASPFVIRHGDRIAQLLYLPAGAILSPSYTFSNLSLFDRPTTRTGGFGSTGV